MEETRRVFPEADLSQVYLTTAGVRPLVRDPKAQKEGQVSRKHAIEHHDGEGMPGFISVLGGKITNMRSVAEETVDEVVRCLGKSSRPCATHREPFPGGSHPSLDRLKEELAQQYGSGPAALSRQQVDYLVDLYGALAPAVLELTRQDPDLAKPIREDDLAIWAQLAYGIEREWVYTTADFLLRRTPLGMAPGLAADIAAPVAERLGRRLGRSPEEIAQDIAQYEETIQRMGYVPQTSSAGTEQTG